MYEDMSKVSGKPMLVAQVVGGEPEDIAKMGDSGVQDVAMAGLKAAFPSYQLPKSVTVARWGSGTGHEAGSWTFLGQGAKVSCGQAGGQRAVVNQNREAVFELRVGMEAA